jgi:hypothetical protein
MENSQREWIVVRSDDNVEVGSYASKPKAVAASLRFGTDGRHYRVEERRRKESDPPGTLVPLRGH